MRGGQLVGLVVLALVSVSLGADESSKKPVLSRLGTKLDASPLGDHFEAAEFKDQLTISLPRKSELTLILIDADEPLTRKQFMDELVGFELERDALLQGQVERPFATLMDFVNAKEIRVNQLVVPSLNDGLTKFAAAQSTNKPVIMLQNEGESRSERHKRQAGQNEGEKAPTNKTRTYAFGDQCAAFFDSVSFVDDSVTPAAPPKELPVDQATFTCSSAGLGGTQVFGITFKDNAGIMGKSINQISFQFQVSNNSQYFVLNSSSLTLANQEQHPLMYMGTPYVMETPVNFSFACTRTPFMLRFVSPDTKATVKFRFFVENLQLQALGITPNGTSYSFGQVNYCQGFFSSGIWMAITSSLLLALILAFGVTALMSIQTHDRLDDPKGKPLNIGVEK